MNLSHRLLAFAVRRWPSEIRREQQREWEAEMHAIRHDMSAGPLLRRLRALRFAFSLAASPPAEDENGVPRGWRELLPERGRRFAPVLLLAVATAVVGMLGRLLPQLVFQLAGGLTNVSNHGTASTRVSWTVGTTVALMCAAVAFGGVRLGARFPMPSAVKVFATVTATSAVLTVLVPGTSGPLFADDGSVLLADLIALAVWGIALFVATAVSRRLSRRGPWIAITMAAASLVTLDLAAIVSAQPFVAGREGLADAPLWFPLALINVDTGYGVPVADGDVVAMALNDTMSTLVAITALAVAYALRSRKAGRPAVPTTPAPATPVARGLAPARWAAGAIGVIALGIWATVIGFATDTPFAPIVLEARLAALLTVVLAGAVVLTGLGRPLLAALIAAPLLIGVDAVLDRFGAHGAAGVTQAAGLAAVLLAVSWWLSDRVLPGRSASTTVPLVTVAVLAAFCTSGRFSAPVTTDAAGLSMGVPATLTTATIAVSALLLLLAAVAALAGRREGRNPYIAGPVLLGTLALLAAPASGGFSAKLYTSAIGVLMTAAVLFTIRGRGGWRSVRRWLLGALVAVVVSLPAVLLCMAFGRPLTAGLLRVTGHDGVYDVDAFLAGAILLGAAGALLTAVLPESLPSVGTRIATGRPDPALP